VRRDGAGATEGPLKPGDGLCSMREPEQKEEGGRVTTSRRYHVACRTFPAGTGAALGTGLSRFPSGGEMSI
jgi:hypothetical protein